MSTGPDDGELDHPTSHLTASGRLPLTSEFPAQPPPRSRAQTAVIAGSIAAIVAVVAAVVVIVLTHRGTGGQAGRPTGVPPRSTTSSSSSGTSSATTSSTTAPTSGTAGWHQVAGTSAAGLTYSVPPGWTDSTKSRSTGRGEQWGGVAEFGTYQCPGGRYTRGFVAGGKPPSGDAADLGKLATSYAKALATHWYPDPRTVAGEPQQRQVDGHDAVQVTAKLTIQPQNPDCDADTAEVVVLAVHLDNGVGMLAAVDDLERRPREPRVCAGWSRPADLRDGPRSVSRPIQLDFFSILVLFV